jgi:SAM-dependent methyltransferase
MDMRKLNRSASWRRGLADDQRALAQKLHAHRTTLNACPICRHAGISMLGAIHGFGYAECSSCGHVFCHTPPSGKAVEALYAGRGPTRSVQGKVYLDPQVLEQRLVLIGRPKAEFILQWLPAPPGLWVDVGCGPGDLLVAARDAGWNVHGFEADTTETELARQRGLAITEGYLTEETAAQLPAHTTVLTSLNVLEHLPHPVQWLKAMVRMLSQGAFVIIEVPRHPSLSSLTNLLFPHLAYRHIYPPDHLHVFTERSAEHMLRSAGLLPVAVWTFGQDFQELVAVAVASAALTENALLHRVLDAAPAIQSAVDAQMLSDVLLVVARKSDAYER